MLTFCFVSGIACEEFPNRSHQRSLTTLYTSPFEQVFGNGEDFATGMVEGKARGEWAQKEERANDRFGVRVGESWASCPVHSAWVMLVQSNRR